MFEFDKETKRISKLMEEMAGIPKEMLNEAKEDIADVEPFEIEGNMTATIKDDSQGSGVGRYSLKVKLKPTKEQWLRHGTGGLVLMANNHLYKTLGFPARSPMVDGEKDSARKGIKELTLDYRIDNAALAYGLGLDMVRGHGAVVGSKSEVKKRMTYAEKLAKMAMNYKNAAKKATEHLPRSEADKAWKEEYMDEYVKMGDNAKKKGIVLYKVIMNEDVEREMYPILIESKIHDDAIACKAIMESDSDEELTEAKRHKETYDAIKDVMGNTNASTKKTSRLEDFIFELPLGRLTISKWHDDFPSIFWKDGTGGGIVSVTFYPKDRDDKDSDLLMKQIKKDFGFKAKFPTGSYDDDNKISRKENLDYFKKNLTKILKNYDQI